MTYDLQTLLLIEVDKMAVLASLVCGVLIWRSRREVPDRSRIILFLITLTALPIIGKVASLMMHGLDNRFVEVLPIVPTLMGLITIGLMLLYAVEVMRPNWFRWRQVLWVLLSLACVLVLAVLFKDQFTVLHSNDDIWQHIDEPNVLLRLLHEDAVWRNPDLGLEMFCQLLGTRTMSRVASVRMPIPPSSTMSIGCASAMLPTSCVATRYKTSAPSSTASASAQRLPPIATSASTMASRLPNLSLR